MELMASDPGERGGHGLTDLCLSTVASPETDVQCRRSAEERRRFVERWHLLYIVARVHVRRHSLLREKNGPITLSGHTTRSP